jgi:A/G-specific adenine glycosylase
VVDGNVERVFARYAGSELTGGALHKAAWAWAALQIPADRPGDWNQAMMELGATVCRTREPHCASCPLSKGCAAFLQARQDELPRPKSKPETIHLRREAWVYACKDRFGLEQIPGGEWWEGMWRFPASGAASECPIGAVKHVVTHHRITMDVHLVECARPTPDLMWYSLEELKHLPMPAPQRLALKLAIEALSVLSQSPAT